MAGVGVEPVLEDNLLGQQHRPIFFVEPAQLLSESSFWMKSFSFFFFYKKSEFTIMTMKNPFDTITNFGTNQHSLESEGRRVVLQVLPDDVAHGAAG